MEYENVFTAYLVAAGIILLMWGIYFFSGMHRHFMQRDAEYKRVLLPLLGVIAIAIGVVSVITGESSLGQGNVALRAIEPQRFWQIVALQIGTGCSLIVIGLLYPRRNS